MAHWNYVWPVSKVEHGLSEFSLVNVRCDAFLCTSLQELSHMGCVLGDVTIVYDDVITNYTVAREPSKGLVHLVIVVFQYG